MRSTGFSEITYTFIFLIAAFTLRKDRHTDFLQLKSLNMITNYLEKINEEKDTFGLLWIKLLLRYIGTLTGNFLMPKTSKQTSHLKVNMITYMSLHPCQVIYRMKRI